MIEIEQLADKWVNENVEFDEIGNGYYYGRRAYMDAYNQAIKDYIQGNPRWLKATLNNEQV